MTAGRPITDEMLMAYADGALSEAEARAVEAHLADDAQARRLVAAFRESAELAAQAFDEPMTAEVPQRLIDAVRSQGSEQGGGNGGRVIRGPWQRRAALPLAAAVALTAGLSLGYWFLGTTGRDDLIAGLRVGPLAQGSDLAGYLERRSSGATETLSSDRALLIVGTFRDRGARPCREFEILTRRGGEAATPEAAAIACRAAAGTWTVEGVVRIAAAPEDATGQGYVPSGAREEDALAKLIEVLGASALLPAAEEAQLIANGWAR